MEIERSTCVPKQRAGAVHIHIGDLFYGAGNVGDDLMMAGFLASMSHFLDCLHLTCCTPFDLHSQRLRFPQVHWLPSDPQSQRACIQDCDVWLGLGGSPFQSVVGSWNLEYLNEQVGLCRAEGKPVYFLGVGVNDEEAVALPQAQKILGSADHIWTRDARSANLLSEHGGSKIEEGCDLSNAFLSHLFSSFSRNSQAIGLLLNFEDAAMYDASLLETLLEKAQFDRCYWLVQEVRRLPGSEQVLFDLLSERWQARCEQCLPRYEDASIMELLQAWPIVDLLISSRYHGLLFYAWRGARILPVFRSSKIRGLAEQLGISGCSSLSEIQEQLRSAVRIPRARLERLALGARSMTERFCATVGLGASNSAGSVTSS